jgi:hypothetical protein
MHDEGMHAHMPGHAKAGPAHAVANANAPAVHEARRFISTVLVLT